MSNHFTRTSPGFLLHSLYKTDLNRYNKVQIVWSTKLVGQRILDKIPEGSFVIPLCIEGTPYSTEQFQKKWDQWNKESINNITFIIGGSLGLSPKVVSKGKLKLSFSRMTFPHQLMRLILIEQLSYL